MSWITQFAFPIVFFWNYGIIWRIIVVACSVTEFERRIFKFWNVVFQPNESFDDNGEAVKDEMCDADEQKGFPRNGQHQETGGVDDDMNKTVQGFFRLVQRHPIRL